MPLGLGLRWPLKHGCLTIVYLEIPEFPPNACRLGLAALFEVQGNACRHLLDCWQVAPHGQTDGSEKPLSPNPCTLMPGNLESHPLRAFHVLHNSVLVEFSVARLASGHPANASPRARRPAGGQLDVRPSCGHHHLSIAAKAPAAFLEAHPCPCRPASLGKSLGQRPRKSRFGWTWSWEARMCTWGPF